jgi:hypothetical protein
LELASLYYLYFTPMYLALATLILAAVTDAKLPKYQVMARSTGAVKGLKTRSGEAVLCEGCVDLLDNGINELLNVILGGIPAGCSQLCTAAFGTSVESEVCTALCDGVGLYEFINTLENADISPVWACLEFDACQRTTCTSNCANITRLASNPTSATPPQAFTWTYVVTFAPGVGLVTSFGGINQLGGNGSWGSDNGFIWYETTANTPYQVSLPSTLEVMGQMGLPNECPPAGKYQLVAEVCEGQCGDTFKISGPVLAQAADPNPLTVGRATDGCVNP